MTELIDVFCSSVCVLKMRSHEGLCRSLRAQIEKARRHCLSKTAAFYAEKLMSLSTEVEDVYLAGWAFYDNGEFRRTVALFQKHELTRHSSRFLYLTAKCFLEASEWKLCAELLDGDGTEDNQMNFDDEVDWKGSLFYLRGRVDESLENFGNAVEWYQKALVADPFCYEAFHALVERNLISPQDEDRLLAELSLTSENSWIKKFYICITSRYGNDLEDKLEELRDVSGADEYESVTQSPVLEAEEIPESQEQLQNGENEVHIGLELSLDVQLSKARLYLNQGAYPEGYILTKRLLEESPETKSIYPLYFNFCFLLGNKDELYRCTHELSEKGLDQQTTYLGMGLYYMSIKRFADARKAFRKAIDVDQYSLDCWLAYGNCHAALREADPAMEAYRAAHRRFPGSHLPCLYIGMEQLRLKQLSQARTNFAAVNELCPEDPLISNQLGVLEYEQGNYELAIDWFQQALNKLPRGERLYTWVNVFINLGHALRKQRRYQDAITQYQTAQNYAPRLGCIFTALGFTYHLQYRLNLAIENYLRAVEIDSNDQFASDMLAQAMDDKLENL